jgi:hypothetical protein
MKQTEQLKAAQEQMKPGRITLTGFLGEDARPLIDILAADDALVKRMDLTHQLIAERMIALREAGKRGLGDFIAVEPHFEVRVDSVRGRLPCPFDDPGLFPKTNITVRNLELQEELTFTDLGIHMIYVHGFYGGKSSSFRVDPDAAARILEIPHQAAPGVPGN